MKRAKSRAVAVGFISAALMFFTPMAPATAAAQVNVSLNFNSSQNTANARGAVYKTGARIKSICVVLWHGVAYPPRGYTWYPRKINCKNLNYAGQGLSIPSGSYTCHPGIYYGQIRLYTKYNPRFLEDTYSSQKSTSQYSVGGFGC